MNTKRLVKALLLTLPLAFGFFYTIGVNLLFLPAELLAEHGIELPLERIIGICVQYLGAVTLLFLIFYKDRIDFFRKFIFIPAAACFTLWFTVVLFQERGHLFIYTAENINCGTVPFCHIVIPQTLLPTLLSKEFVFPGTVSKWTFSMLSMVVAWISVSLALGRGFCSWACFWGGWESGASSILKRPIIKKLPKNLKWGAFAMLLSIVLTSLVSFTAVYCIWLCPFQGVSEFAEVTDHVTLIKFIIFTILFLSLVIVLPLLTKKRVQCISFCPFGAFQSLVEKISPIDIRVDRKKCNDCGKCIKQCPMNAISKETLAKGRVDIHCVKCGKCVDNCTKRAAVFHLKGTPVGWLQQVFKVIFIYLAFLILVMQLGGFISGAIEIIMGGLLG